MENQNKLNQIIGKTISSTKINGSEAADDDVIRIGFTDGSFIWFENTEFAHIRVGPTSKESLRKRESGSEK